VRRFRPGPRIPGAWGEVARRHGRRSRTAGLAHRLHVSGRADRPSSGRSGGQPVVVPGDAIDFAASLRHATVFAGIAATVIETTGIENTAIEDTAIETSGAIGLDAGDARGCAVTRGCAGTLGSPATLDSPATPAS
jgi:hypothetical protein